MSGVGITASVDRPVVGRSGGPIEVAMLLELSPKDDSIWALPLDLLVVAVGQKNGPIARVVLTAIGEACEGDDRVRAVGPNGGVDPWQGVANDPHPTMAAALESVKADGAGARALVVVDQAVAEPLEPLVAAATALAELGRPFDVLCTEPAVDLGLLTRLTALGGGELLSTEGRGAVFDTARTWIRCLKTRAVRDARIEFEFADDVQPLQLLRVEPRPLFLGNVRLANGASRRLVIDPGVVSREALPSFVLVVEAPARARGQHRIAHVTFIARSDQGTLRDRVTVTQTYDEGAGAFPLVDARVNYARGRVEACAIVEDAARAYTGGDARKVSMLLERLVRHYATLGDNAATERAYQTRLRFLRTGLLARGVLNQLRRSATNREWMASP